MAEKIVSDEQFIDGLNRVKHGELSYRKLAKELGYASHVPVLNRRNTLIKRGLWDKESPINKPAPDPFYLKRRSEYTSKDGDVSGWNIYEMDKVKQAEMMREAVEALVEEIEPAKPIKLKPKSTLSDLCSMYAITDYHLGMMSWGEETGADWDMKIAEDSILAWFQSAISSTPDSKYAVLANIGDFMHWDGLDAVTPASKHVLDADTRFQKLIRVAIRIWRKVIPMLLEKHEQVYVIMADANHDESGEAWLREMLHAFYEHEPRVTVDNTADTYYCYEHGSVSLFFHHGHKRKVANIDTVFAAKFRDVFGRTKFSYGHMGHLHSVDVKETNLMIVEQHRTLAAPDAYASRGGWMSGRDAKVITYHKDYGEVARSVISFDMVADSMAR